MKYAPLGQKWWITFTDKDGNNSGGLTNNFNYLPKVIDNILRAGGSNIVITDQTIYKDDSYECKRENNVVELPRRG